MRMFVFFLVIGPSMMTGACKNAWTREESRGDPVVSAEDRAHEIFEYRCSSCHGKQGKGDGPGAAALTPRPRDYTNRLWQSTVTDEELRKVILYGGAKLGKSPSMPGNPDVDNSAGVLDALIAMVRAFGN